MTLRLSRWNQIAREKVLDNFELLVGLGVGIPLGTLLILTVIVVTLYCRRTKERDHFSESSFYDQRSRASMEGFASTGMLPTKFNGRARRGPLSGPHQWETDSDMSSASFHRGLSTADTQQFHSAYEGFYQGRLERTDANHEDQQEQSNFSWDFMYEHVNPKEKYEIRRPQTDQIPNPLYDMHS
ncbi:hypothetical protein CHS0354_043191 [Potamilus streckersoni]|uniref:Uncharacterized protein n=1 Tax=Potamilus streckersoni TaxID=2493646 RepID=A0AAE0SNS8_9BIVA|nr:hypothetical protein CHS0354_043191 [Potamilus streckersoni]